MTNIQYHFTEIKFRIFYFIFSVISTFLLCYSYQLEILYIIGKPFLEFHQTFIFLDLTEAFYTLIKISTLFTLLLVIPFFLYHFWCFFIPSFYDSERKKINFYFSLFFFLFFSEFLVTYFFLLPKICNFLLSFEMSSEINTSRVGGWLPPLLSIEFTARIESYVNLFVKILCSILLFFQIPLIICYFYSKKMLHVASLHDNRKFLSLLSLLISAFIVPPDILSQLVVATFFYLIFEVLILIGLFFEEFND